MAEGLVAFEARELKDVLGKALGRVETRTEVWAKRPRRAARESWGYLRSGAVVERVALGDLGLPAVEAVATEFEVNSESH